MLTELKFVQGAVAKKDFVPALTHFSIKDGVVRGYNGVLALCTPIPFDISCNPKASPLIKAISNCETTVTLALTPAGRLSIKSGKFKAFIDCVDGDTPHVDPEGEHVVMDGEALLKAIKVVEPFIGDDASRPWTNGVLLLGQSAFATNNVALVEYWTGATFDAPINLPRAAIKEMLRINEAPEAVQRTANSLTFHYKGGRWLRTQLLETTWPDLTRVLNKESAAKPLDPELFVGLDAIKPFADKMGRVIFRDGGIRTHEDATEGSGYDIPNFDHVGVYQLDMLRLLEGTATTIDWSQYPNACMFFGERLRGALIGMKQ